MNNKRGGAGAKIILVLILMIASAVGGGYGYRVLDGKLAVREATKVIEDVDVADYDSPENTEIQGYKDKATKDLQTAKTRKDVYVVMDEFKTDVSKVQTKAQKELAEAKRAAEEAKNNNNNNNNNNNGYNNNNNSNNNNGNSYNNNNGYDDSNNNSYNNNNGYSNDSNDNNNNNNNNSNSNGSGSGSSTAITNDDGTSGKNSPSGILNSILGGDD